MTNPVNADQLRVIVEMGDDYQPSERLAAALTELAVALTEGDADVSGFGFDPVRSFVFGSGTPAPGDGYSFPKIEFFDQVDSLYGKHSPIYKW